MARITASMTFTYDVNAPYGSINYHIGKVAIGGSLRYDVGTVRGQLYGGELGGGRIGAIAYDVNGNGVISVPEQDVSVLPLGAPGQVHYNYHYLSYSVGANYRIAEQLAVFGRYSRGARAAADRILFSSAINNSTGNLVDPKTAYDSVRQAELGLKFRNDAITVNLTGFYAKTGDRNAQFVAGPDGGTILTLISRPIPPKVWSSRAAIGTAPSA